MDNIIYVASGYGLTIICLIVGMIYQETRHRAEVKRINEEKKDLMNRVMARDFKEYVGGSKALIPASDSEILDDLIDASDIEREKAEAYPVN